jgi:hypothetical protein
MAKKQQRRAPEATKLTQKQEVGKQQKSVKAFSKGEELLALQTFQVE